MTSPHEQAPVDPVARQLVGALLSALALVLALRGALGASSPGWLLLWLLGAVVLAVVVGRLLEASGVPRPFATALTTAGAFAVLALAGLTLVALLGEPGDDNVLSLVVGLPAAALAAVGASAVLGLRKDDEAVIIAAVGGFFIVLVASNGVGGLVDEARDDAAQIQVFTEAGLTPYVPEIGGLEALMSGTSEARPVEGGPLYVTGYRLVYKVEVSGDPFNPAYVGVDVLLGDDTPACEESSFGSTVCREGDGYVIEESDGEVEEVIADLGDMRLVANFFEGEGELPSPEDVGQALAEAESVAWENVVGLDDQYPED